MKSRGYPAESLLITGTALLATCSTLPADLSSSSWSTLENVTAGQMRGANASRSRERCSPSVMARSSSSRRSRSSWYTALAVHKRIVAAAGVVGTSETGGLGFTRSGGGMAIEMGPKVALPVMFV